MREIKFRAWNTFRKEMKLDVDSSLGRTADSNGPLFQLMEYTGLKDRNGKEIYEGDILKTSMTDGRDEVEEVSFDDSTGGFFPFTADMCTASYGVKELEVIGNIHENPDLLPDAQKQGS